MKSNCSTSFSTFFVLFVATVVVVHFLYFCIAETSYSAMMHGNANNYNGGFVYEERFNDITDTQVTNKIGKVRVETIEDSVLIYFVFQTEGGHYISDAHVTLDMRHPATAKDTWDISTVLEEKEPGLYLATIKKKCVGQWEIKIVATKDEEEFVLQQRLVLHYKNQ